MSVKFLTRPLERDQVAQAFALIQSVDPGLSLDRWTRFANKMIAPTRAIRHTGIMTVQTEAGYMCGLFAYEIADDLRLNRTLIIRNLFAISLVAPEAIMRALLEAAEALAHLNGCAAVTAVVDGDAKAQAMDWMLSQLAVEGFQRTGVVSAKTLGSAGLGHPVLGRKA